MLKTFFNALLLGVVVIGISACANTLDGAGRDIQKAGEKIQETF